MPAPDLLLQTVYAELLERAEAASFADAFPEDGTFTPKTVHGRRYWYFQTGTAGDRVQRYVGPETEELLERIRHHKDVRQDQRERRALVSTLVRSFSMPRPNPEIGALVDALAKAGVFRLRGTLVGTVAYQTYPAMLGTRLASSIMQTGDIDIAQFTNVSVAVSDRTPPILEILRTVDKSFQPVPHVSENHKSASYRAKGGFRVDFLTPNEGPDTDAPQPLPSLGTDAQPLRFLDFLIHEPVPAVLLHGSGVPVHVPAPERYAVHKMIVSPRRKTANAKADKDLHQAGALLEALWQRRPHELADAWQEAFARGDTWRKSMLESARRIAPAARDGLLKTLEWTRDRIPGLELAFPDPRPRYDFDRMSVMFTGKDSGGGVRCIISGEALRDHFNVQGSNPRDYVAQYDDHRSLFEDLARAKYRTWPIEEPGVVLLGTVEIPRLLRDANRSLPSLTQP